jgi:hypothetical protein
MRSAIKVAVTKLGPMLIARVEVHSGIWWTAEGLEE